MRVDDFDNPVLKISHITIINLLCEKLDKKIPFACLVSILLSR